VSPLRRIVIAGVASTTAMLVLVVTEARFGTATFFACFAVAASAYLVVLHLIWFDPAPQPRRLLFIALGLALLIRIPLVVSPIGPGSDMFRYIWDGRVQRLGYNPYAVLPSDPALASTHVDDNTRLMASRNSRTPYPPAAQMFFRLVVSIRESVYLVRAALFVCDLLTIFIIWKWLHAVGACPAAAQGAKAGEWLTLAYAWNPLVILEIAFSGHIDALCMLWTALCACMIARRRPALAAAAFALAVASKLLPIVLAPMLWGRIRIRDAALGALILVLLYLPFTDGSNPFVEVNMVVERIRFNGPIFQAVSDLATPRAAAAFALALGLLVAAICRWKLPAENSAAWAWPMAAAIVAAPVIYPWYLLSLTPFLLLPATLPLTAWTLGVFAAYRVWEIAWNGGPWIVPIPLLLLQYGLVLAGLLGSFNVRTLNRTRNLEPGTRNPEP
jgi:hypothetical protein